MSTHTPRRPVIALPVLACLLSVLESAAGPPLFCVIDLGTLGGEQSHATAVSEAGHVVGWSETANVTTGGDPVRHAFLWYEDHMEDLGALDAGQSESVAYGVNARGQVVGWYQAPFDKHAFLWLPEPAYGLPAGMNDLGTLGHEESEARDINERGEIVGVTDRATFLWLPDPAFGLQAGMNDLCQEFVGPGACPHSGAALNNLGQVVAGEYLWLPHSCYGRDAGWSARGSTKTDISNAGVVVGNASSTYGVFYLIHDLWQEHSTVLQFPSCGSLDIPCEIASGTGVNDKGNTVGVWMSLLGPVKAGVFTKPGGVDRWWLLDQRRLVYSPGWIVTSAANISNHDFVVGTGMRYDGPERAVLLVPIDANVDGLGGVTLNDYFEFQQCLNGPGACACGPCHSADLEGDNDVDLSDYVALLRAFEDERMR